MFSMLATSYLFLGGAGAGMLVVLCVLECFNAQRRFGSSNARTRLGRTFAGLAMGPLRIEPSSKPGAPRYFEGGYSQSEVDDAAGRWIRGALLRELALPADFFMRAWPVCLVVLMLGILCLVADLGRPDQLLAFALAPRVSVMTVGAFALGAALFVAGGFALGANFDGVVVTPALVYALGAVGAVVGLISVVYTGVLLSGLASVLFWQTPLILVVFALSSLSCGVALVFLAAAFVDTRQVIVRPLGWLFRVDGLMILLELVFLGAYLAWGLAGEGTFAAAYALVAGDLRWMFWGGVVAVGLVSPLVMERFVAHSNRSTQLVWVAAAVLLGGFLLRWCLVGAAEYDESQQLLGQMAVSAARLL